MLDFSSGAVAAEVTAELAAQLQRTVLSLESALKKIKQAEAVLNKTDAVTTGALTYLTHKAVSTVFYNYKCTPFVFVVPCQLVCVDQSPVFSVGNVFLTFCTGAIGERSAHCGPAESALRIHTATF